MLTEKWEKMGAWGPLAALKSVGETKWLIDGVIPSGSITWMVAPPQSLKTFVALDMACCIASGRPWHGRETDGAVVLYLAAEGGNDIHVRRAAADMAAGDTGALCIVQMRPRLDEPQGLAALLALVYEATCTGDEHPIDFPEIYRFWEDSESKYLTDEEKKRYDEIDMAEGCDASRKYALRVSRPRFSAWDEAIAKVYEDMDLQFPGGVNPKLAKNVFLIIDTYSQTSCDDTKLVVSRYIKNLHDLQGKAAAMGGTITAMVIDHCTKSGDSYMGSLAKEGDSDTMIDLERHGSSVTLKCPKMKMAVPFGDIHLEVKPLVLEGFTDALGRPLTSLIVTDGEQAHKVRKAAGTTGDTAAAILLGLVTGDTTEAELRQLFLTHPSNVQKKTDSVGRTFRRAFDGLITINAISVDSDGVVRSAQDTADS